MGWGWVVLTIVALGALIIVTMRNFRRQLGELRERDEKKPDRD